MHGHASHLEHSEKIRNEELWERAGQEPVAKQILRRKPGNYGTCGAGRVIIHIIRRVIPREAPPKSHP
nr:hypothetical protein BaRGS_005168 [Batillaria attramentaria]